MVLEVGVEITLSEPEIIERVNWFLKEEKRIRGRYENMVKGHDFLYLSNPIGSISTYGNTYHNHIDIIKKIISSYQGFAITAGSLERRVLTPQAGYETYFTVPENLFSDTKENIIAQLVRYYEKSFKKRINTELSHQKEELEKIKLKINIINKLKNGEDIK
jgi:hypothetical protein